MNMPLLDRINHCTPNKSAYWCSACECHSQFTITYSKSRTSSGTTTHENYRCHGCNRRMFCPGVVAPWSNGLLGFAFFAVVLLPLIDLQFGFRVDGLIPCSIGFGVFFGVIGFWMGSELRKWKAWGLDQQMKSTAELASQARAHPHQPVHGDSETDFDAWAEQFLSQENLRELHAEHGYEWPGSDDASAVKSHWYTDLFYDPDLKYSYFALYACLVAAALFFTFVEKPSKRQEAGHDAVEQSHDAGAHDAGHQEHPDPGSGDHDSQAERH